MLASSKNITISIFFLVLIALNIFLAKESYADNRIAVIPQHIKEQQEAKLNNTNNQYTVNNLPPMRQVSPYVQMRANNMYNLGPYYPMVNTCSYNNPCGNNNVTKKKSSNPYFDRSRPNPYFSR